MLQEKKIKQYRPDEDQKLQPDQELVFYAAAPGVGKQVYRITHIDRPGRCIYGILVEDTIRILEPWEVI